MPKTVIAQIGSASGIVGSVSLFAVGDRIAAVVRNGPGAGISVTGIRIHGITAPWIVAWIVALVLGSDRSPNKGAGSKGCDAGPSAIAITLPLAVRGAAISILISHWAVTEVTMACPWMGRAVNALR